MENKRREWVCSRKTDTAITLLVHSLPSANLSHTLVPEEEPSPAEQQQQIVNILRGIMSSGQPPPAYSPSSAPQHNYAPQPAQPLVNGGAGVPVPLSKAHQPSTNTGVCGNLLEMHLYTHMHDYTYMYTCK